MAFYSFPGTKSTAKSIARQKKIISVGLDNPGAFYASTNYSSVEYRGGQITIVDSSCGNQDEIKKKYGC